MSTCNDPHSSENADAIRVAAWLRSKAKVDGRVVLEGYGRQIEAALRALADSSRRSLPRKQQDDAACAVEKKGGEALCWDDLAVIASAIGQLAGMSAPEATISRMVEPLLKELDAHAGQLIRGPRG